MPVTKTVHATCSCADQLEVYSSFPCCCIWFASPAVIKMTSHTHATCGHTAKRAGDVLCLLFIGYGKASWSQTWEKLKATRVVTPLAVTRNCCCLPSFDLKEVFLTAALLEGHLITDSKSENHCTNLEAHNPGVT